MVHPTGMASPATVSSEADELEDELEDEEVEEDASIGTEAGLSSPATDPASGIGEAAGTEPEAATRLTAGASARSKAAKRIGSPSKLTSCRLHSLADTEGSTSFFVISRS